ncbi:endonuclease MutS2 [bacterium]|nr:endonuclease MutS2 [bacterium]
MNKHTLEVLEFRKVVRMLVDRTSFEPGAERAVALQPTVDLVSIEHDLTITTELRALIDDGERLPIDRARDARALAERSSRTGAMLSCADLLDVKGALAATREVRGFASKRRARAPVTWNLAEGLCSFPEIEDAIGRAVDDVSVELKDNASRELSKIRRALERTRARIDEKLQSILRKELRDHTVQEAAVHIRNGRLVLPVKRASRSHLKGIVHDQSSSGATLFIEPMSTVPLNNELAELASAEKKEIERILRALTADVGVEADAIRASIVILAKLDCFRAAALLSRDLDCVRPAVTADGRLRIRDGRHPVLDALFRETDGSVVPLSLDLGVEGSTLVISGPNAGGKTVTLKTVGLLVTMAMCGLHVPAGEGTELSIFREIFADIGDEQSSEMSLSTFSSHLRTIHEILEDANERTLVLLDELGAGTDPDEGAGLAIAILEELTGRGTATIATTHLGVVKNHVHEFDGMVNGSMAFDPETLEPSFRFVPGTPGASHALAIAETQGLPESVIARARELRDADAARVDGLLADLVAKERALETTLGRAEVERERASLLTKDYEDRLAGVKDERKQIRTRALAEAREILDRAQGLVEETVKELRETAAAREAIKRARRKVKESRAEVVERLQEVTQPVLEVIAEEPLGELEVGMRVRLRPIRREGELLELPDGRGQVRVRVKNTTLTVAADELIAAAPKSEKTRMRPKVDYELAVDTEPATELHLRGMTTDEIEDAIDTFLSTAVMQGFTVVSIVHGKGTGALRAKTQEVLRTIPAVKSFRLGKWGEGDIGVTIVELK